MTSTIKVDTIQTAAGGVPRAEDLGMNISGTIVGYSIAKNTSSSTGSADQSNVNTITYTPKVSGSTIILTGVWQHGIGPASTNLDGWGCKFYLFRDSTGLDNTYRHDVFPGGFTVSYTYGPEWYINTAAMICSSTTHSAGTSYNWHQKIGVDIGSNYWMINRCYANSETRGTTSLTLVEIAP